MKIMKVLMILVVMVSSQAFADTSLMFVSKKKEEINNVTVKVLVTEQLFSYNKIEPFPGRYVVVDLILKNTSGHELRIDRNKILLITNGENYTLHNYKENKAVKVIKENKFFSVRLSYYVKYDHEAEGLDVDGVGKISFENP